jgi:hypothetical protein
MSTASGAWLGDHAVTGELVEQLDAWQQFTLRLRVWPATSICK